MSKLNRKKMLSILIAFTILLSVISAVFIPLGLSATNYFTNYPISASATGPVELSKTIIETGNTENSSVSPTNTDKVSGITGAQSTSSMKSSRLVEQSKERFSQTDAANIPQADDIVNFIVVMKNEPLLSAFSVDNIAAETDEVNRFRNGQTQAIEGIKSLLESSFGHEEGFQLGFDYTVATTGLSVTTKYSNKAVIEDMLGVDRVYIAPTFELQVDDAQTYTNNATGMIGSTTLNETGFTGKGMKIAIVDTGIVVNHPSFQALSQDKLTETSLTKEYVNGIWNTLNASKTSLRNSSYYNSKLPFIFNYETLDFDVSHAVAQHDHGTHVAGIAAANKIDSTSVVGVAPDAQLIVMQVFSRGGGASWSTILAALEDCVKLNVDAVNLSLGTAAGFTDGDAEFTAVLNRFKNTDIQVLIAGGNDTHSGYMNRTGQNLSKATNPDHGLLGSPASNSVALAVASADNNGADLLYFTVNGHKIGFSDSAVTANTNFLQMYKNQSLKFVVIGGDGEASDYAGIDVTGKVAVVSRGVTSFQDKQRAAKEAGAIACVVYNNVSGSFLMAISDGYGHIPCISVSMSDGQFLKQLANDSLTVCNGDLIHVNIDSAMSDFSSWGVTPDLKLKPEITGVGGNVYATRDPSIGGSNYGEMSGTSMAAPQVSGAMAVLTQYLRENYQYQESDLRRVATNLMMSTASQVMLNNVEYSPRNQGAGLVNLLDATQSQAYLSSPGVVENRPKGEMGDDPAQTGVFSFPFQITNMSSQDKTYSFDSSVMTADIASNACMADATKALNAKVAVSGEERPAQTIMKYDFNDDGKITNADAQILQQHVNQKNLITESNAHYAYLDINNDGVVDRNDIKIILDYCAERKVPVNLLETATISNSGDLQSVTVPANQTVTLTATVALTEEDKSFMNQNFANGIYVEGFLYVNSSDADGVNLSMPFLGFYGDWSQAPVFDEEGSNASLYSPTVFTNQSKLGDNPYFAGGKAGDTYNAISYANPLSEMNLGLLRNVKTLEHTVEDAATGIKFFSSTQNYITKTYFDANYGRIIPHIIVNYENEVNIWDGKNNGFSLLDGTKATYTLKAYLDDGDDIADDTYSFTVTIDNTKPVIVNAGNLHNEIKTDAENGTVTLPLTLQDNQHIAAVIFESPSGVTLGKYQVDNTPGQALTQEFDITGYGTDFTIVVADYACNETELKVSINLDDISGSQVKPKQLDKNRLYGNETYDLGVVSKGWFSGNKTDFTDLQNETFDTSAIYYSGEYVNGYVIAQRASDGAIELLTPYNTYWSAKTLVTQQVKVGDSGFYVLYDMALDYSISASYNGTGTKNTLYAVGWKYAGDNNGDGKDDGYNALFQIVFSPDGNVSVQEVNKITGLPNKVEGLTLGCTTEGQLYTISTEGKLYQLSKQGNAALVGITDFVNAPNYSGVNVIQSMGYDHNTGTMYWYAHSQTENGNSYINIDKTYTVNLTNAKCTLVGSSGESGYTSLFVPTDKVSDLFQMNIDPTDFVVTPSSITLAKGQKINLGVEWKPWNAVQGQVTWTSDNTDVATINSSGFVTAHNQGIATISATTQVKDTNGQWVSKTQTATIEVVASSSAIYGYVVHDYKNASNNNSWLTFSDTQPENSVKIKSSGNQLWQGGSYYNGYVYTAVAQEDMGSKTTVVYKSQVTKGATPEQTVIGSPQLIGSTQGIEVGNMAYDYYTGRMYGVDYTNGGLCIIDLDSGAIDLLGTFNGDLKPSVMPAMCVTAEGKIIGSDMDGNLYEVNPDNMHCTKIGSIDQESWFYAGMTYDHNTGNIYWNPCMNENYSSLYLVNVTTNHVTGATQATPIKVGNVSSNAGVEQTAMFTIPDNEPETQYIQVTGIKIINGEAISGLLGGTMQLQAQTTPVRPSANAKVWTSSDESVVKVDQFGKMTFVKTGTATVTVSITNKGNNATTYTDSIEVTVIEATGEFVAFLAHDSGATQYYDYWLTMKDYEPQSSALKDRMINVYSLRTGEYFDGFFYAYNDKGQLCRINSKNYYDYVVLGEHGLGADDQIVSMAYDYKTGTMFGLTLSSNTVNGYLVEINMANGHVTKLKQLSQKVFALAIDKNGVFYAAGSQALGVDAKLYTLNKDTAVCTELITLTEARVFTGPNYYNELQYNSQMTYDYKTNRLYLNATVKHKQLSYSAGMFMIQLNDNLDNQNLQVVNLGKPAIKTNSHTAKVGDLYLGLLCSVPSQEDVPTGIVSSIILDKSAARVEPGNTTQLTAQVSPSNAVNKTVKWSSSNTSIATVNANTGLVTGIKEGTATITATSADNAKIIATCTITVMDSSKINASLAYTVSADKESLISFNPEMPASTAQTVMRLSGGKTIIGMDMKDDRYIYYMTYADSLGPWPILYRLDLTTKQTTNLGQLQVMIGNPSDIAYDPVNKLIYVVSGFYVWQFEESRLQAGRLNSFSGFCDTTKSNFVPYSTLHGVTCKDGKAYFLAGSTTGNKLFSIDDTLTVDSITYIRDVNVNTATGKNELAYDSNMQKFYLTDTADRLYSFTESDSDVTLIDILDNGWDINGLAILPPSRKE